MIKINLIYKLGVKRAHKIYDHMFCTQSPLLSTAIIYRAKKTQLLYKKLYLAFEV